MERIFYTIEMGVIEIGRELRDNFDTGFLSPYLNFALFCAAFVLAVSGLIFGACA